MANATVAQGSHHQKYQHKHNPTKYNMLCIMYHVAKGRRVNGLMMRLPSGDIDKSINTKYSKITCDRSTNCWRWAKSHQEGLLFFGTMRAAHRRSPLTSHHWQHLLVVDIDRRKACDFVEEGGAGDPIILSIAVSTLEF